MYKNLKTKNTKNACTLCYRPVKQKNGLQCNGPCKAWFHFQCLNYTPGKIYDIKKGLVKINCPCPYCDMGKGSVMKAYSSDCLKIGESYQLAKVPENPEIVEQSLRVEYPLVKQISDTCQVIAPKHHGMHGAFLPLLAQFSKDELEENNVPEDATQYNPWLSSDMDPLSLSVMEQMMGTIGELSQKLRCLLLQMQKSGSMGSRRYPFPVMSLPHKTPSPHQNMTIIDADELPEEYPDDLAQRSALSTNTFIVQNNRVNVHPFAHISQHDPVNTKKL